MLIVNSLPVHGSAFILSTIADGEERVLRPNPAGLNTLYGEGESIAPAFDNLVSPFRQDCASAVGFCEITAPMTDAGNASEQASAARDMRDDTRFDVTQFGAVGTGYSTTGSTTAGSKSLVVPDGSAWVVGQGIQVVGAGASGTAPLITKITEIRGNTLTLAVAAGTAVTKATVFADDTAGIQAAFAACWNNQKSPFGGVVEFPGGGHNYTISHTVYAYDSCRIEGTTGAGNRPSFITWKGTKVTGVLIPFTRFTVDVNKSYVGPSSPTIKQPYFITVSATNTLSAGNWVLINGCKSSGTDINNTVAEVAAASDTSFTVVVPYLPSVRGTDLSDSCIATTTAVGIAFAAGAHFQNEVKDIALWQPANYPADKKMGVNFYFGSRIDSGSRIYNVDADSGLYFDYYFSNGGINVDFDKGWRSDASSQIAMVYWRVGGGDHFKMASGSLSANNGASGAYVMLDNQGCNSLGSATGRLSFDNMNFEVDSPFYPGFGAITMLACPTFPGAQFFLSFDNSGVYCATIAGTNCPALAMINKDDAAVDIEYMNSAFTKPFLNLPGLTRADLTGTHGHYSSSSYSHSGKSYNEGSQTADTSIVQALTDFNFEQLWQDGIQASAFLYTDTSFSSLPNGTTLTVGQIVAPPTYWATSKPIGRYALNVVTQAGTTGTPNYGVTSCVRDASRTATLTCSGPSVAISSTSCTANVLTVNTSSNTFAAGEQVILEGTDEPFLNGVNGGAVTVSSANSTSFKVPYTCGNFNGNPSDTGNAVVSSTVDLSPNQFITLGQVKTSIMSINTANPAAILVSTRNSVSAITSPKTLSYTPPVLGSEIQLLTKSASVPSAGTWNEGDFVENSNAKANGVAGWVNITAGSPGIWAAIPLGNSRGQTSAAQISGGSESGDGANLRTAHAFCIGQASSSSTLAMSGAGSANLSCTSAAGPDSVAQLLMTTNGKLGNLAVRCAQQGLNSSSGAFSIWDLPSGTVMSDAGSGVSTGLAVTYGTTKANTTLFDTTHTFAYAKGDLLRIQFTTQANETLGSCQASFNY
jgi:hypothetical protein